MTGEKDPPTGDKGVVVRGGVGSGRRVRCLDGDLYTVVTVDSFGEGGRRDLSSGVGYHSDTRRHWYRTRSEGGGETRTRPSSPESYSSTRDHSEWRTRVPRTVR